MAADATIPTATTASPPAATMILARLCMSVPLAVEEHSVRELGLRIGYASRRPRGVGQPEQRRTRTAGGEERRQRLSRVRDVEAQAGAGRARDRGLGGGRGRAVVGPELIGDEDEVVAAEAARPRRHVGAEAGEQAGG